MLETNGMSAADMAAVVGNGRNNGFGFGGDGAYLLLFLLIAMNGGWNNGGFGGNSGWGTSAPYFYNAQTQNEVSRGFDQAAIAGSLNSIATAVSNGFANAESAAANRQMADMQQAFAAQTAMYQGFTQLGSQFANCCCEQRLANCQTNNTIQNEGNLTRFADANNTRDILNTFNAGTQRILDQLCADKLEQKDDIIAQLRSELMYSRGQASQDVQTAAIQAGQRALANEIEQYVLPTPRPAYIVQNPNCCPNGAYSYGCGYNG